MGKALDSLGLAMNLDHLKESEPRLFAEMLENEYRVLDFSPSDAEGRIVLDVGAHVGTFSMLCWGRGAKSVLSVEPSPINYEKLVRNVSPLGIDALNVAVHDGVNRFVTMQEYGAQSISVPSENGIKSVSLDELVGLFPPGDDMTLKVDTEGAEYDIMLSAPARAIRRFKTIFLECHPREKPERWQRTSLMKDYMSFHGFVPAKEQPMFWNLYNDGKLMSSTVIENWVDFKFVRKKP
jgi:FkbM family methyltransferase